MTNPFFGFQLWDHTLSSVDNGPRCAGGAFQDQESIVSSLEKHPVPLQSQPQTQTRQAASFNLPPKDWQSHEVEPPSKRLRLDVSAHEGPAAGTTGDARNVPGTIFSKSYPKSRRSRPPWSFRTFLLEGNGGGPREDISKNSDLEEEAAAPPSLPNPSWKHTTRKSSKSNFTKSKRDLHVNNVQTTPYRIEVPPAAPVLRPDRVADFSPWTGNQPEDVLNEQTAKQGNYDRFQVSQNEFTTARPSLYTQLRHRSGLHILSSVFAAALQRRHNHSSISTATTFKPPPRVTLTDNKREAWLRDLANPSVPLRKLSRTIPHGVRGRILLDQCLNKWIPVGRAVWLAKCVGANEIRAFKRKGTSGTVALGLELKWVRDWTTNVQQFIEGVVSTCGQTGWKVKVTYAASLAARLFSEHLLDHEHYLDWFLSSLESAPISMLPVWLLMLGAYWNNILRYRKRGGRLTELLLARKRWITQFKQVESLQPLINRISSLVKRIVHEYTSSVILPESWDTCKDTLTSCLDLSHKMDKAIFQILADRNARVQRPNDHRTTAQRSQQQRVIYLLDSIQSTYDYNFLCTECLVTAEDRVSLVMTLLDWIATPYRHGVFRVFTGVRLLREWKAIGIDIDSHIFAFLLRARNNNKLVMGSVYHVISELVRSQTFSVGRYLQWLIARNVVGTSQTNSGKTTFCDVELLVHLPAQRLPEHVHNLRNILMTKAGFSVSEETSVTRTGKASIAYRVPSLFETDLDAAVPRDLSELNVTWTVKSEIGQWILRGVATHYYDATSITSSETSPAAAGASAFTPDEFYEIRDILESFGDLSMLADVLKHASNCNNATVLAASTDTLNYHFDSFSAIGAMDGLFRRLIQAYNRLKKVELASLDLVYSLVELGLRMPNELSIVAVLRQDLSQVENKPAMAASSPVSDNGPDALNEADPIFYQKLDRLLSSENYMDEATLIVTFNILAKQLEFCGSQDKSSANNTCRYLARLRSLAPKHFDILLVRWISAVLRSPTRPSLLTILAPLIGVGCVTIQAFVALLRSLSQRRDATAPVIPDMAEIQMDLARILVSIEPGFSRCYDLVSYRFHLAQQDYFLKHFEEVLCIVRDAAAILDSHYQDFSSKSRRDGFECLVELLRNLLVRIPECANQRYVRYLVDRHPASDAVLRRALDILLCVELHNDPKSTLLEAQKVINMTSDLSLPFCQLKLQLLLNENFGEKVRDSIVDAIFKTAVADARARDLRWTNLILSLDQDAIREVRERAEQDFLSLSILDGLLDDQQQASTDHSSTLETTRTYLAIVEALAHSVPETGVPSIASALAERMDTLLQRLVMQQTNLSNLVSNANASDLDHIFLSHSRFEKALAFSFSALLKMVVIHRSAFHVPLASRNNALPEQTRLLVSILCVALFRLPNNSLRLFSIANCFPLPVELQDFQSLPEILLYIHALDVVASLVDILPDEARYHCSRLLKEKFPALVNFQNDPRFVYLLGPMADLTPVVANAAQPTPIPSPAASSSTPVVAPSSLVPTGSSGPPQSPAPFLGSTGDSQESQDYVAGRLRYQYRGRVLGPHPIRPWELLEDAAPLIGVNDTAIGLGYFDARRIRA